MNYGLTTVNGQEITEQMGQWNSGMVYRSALYAGWRSGNNVVKLSGHHLSIQNASQNRTHRDRFLGIFNFGPFPLLCRQQQARRTTLFI